MEVTKCGDCSYRQGFYHVFLRNVHYQCIVMSMGTQILKSVCFRVSHWVKDLNPHNQKKTNAQCWVRIYNVPKEYKGTVNLLNLARSTGMPLKVDPRTQRTRLYTRIQVDVDCSMDLPEKVFV